MDIAVEAAAVQALHIHYERDNTASKEHPTHSMR
jgi:hypothetical protein